MPGKILQKRDLVLRRLDLAGRQVAIVGIDHPEYSHMAVLSGPAREALARDFAE